MDVCGFVCGVCVVCVVCGLSPPREIRSDDVRVPKVKLLVELDAIGYVSLRMHDCMIRQLTHGVAINYMRG